MSDSPGVPRAVKVSAGMAINMLARGHYQHLENMTRGRFLTSDELRAAVDGHGHQLIEPPAPAFDSMKFRLVATEPARVYETRFALWTKDEGKSQFRVILRLVERSEDDFLVEVIELAEGRGAAQQ